MNYNHGSYKRKQEYLRIIGFSCNNPDCEYGCSIQVHHIIPISSGGLDEFNNYISLCSKCHHMDHNRIHTHWKDYTITLTTWKFYKELSILGFASDCSDADFRKKIKGSNKKFC